MASASIFLSIVCMQKISDLRFFIYVGEEVQCFNSIKFTSQLTSSDDLISLRHAQKTHENKRCVCLSARAKHDKYHLINHLTAFNNNTVLQLVCLNIIISLKMFIKQESDTLNDLSVIISSPSCHSWRDDFLSSVEHKRYLEKSLCFCPYTESQLSPVLMAFIHWSVFMFILLSVVCFHL